MEHPADRRTDAERRTQPPHGARALVAFRAWQERHPALWSSRHLVTSVLGVLGTLLGVSLLLRLLFDKLVPDLDLDIPKPHLPDWLRYLDPLHYLQPVLDRLGGLVPDLDLPHGPPWLKIAVALLIAAGVSVREYKRRTRDREPHGEDG